jgi:hypothetical protein
MEVTELMVVMALMAEATMMILRSKKDFLDEF